VNFLSKYLNGYGLTHNVVTMCFQRQRPEIKGIELSGKCGEPILGGQKSPPPGEKKKNGKEVGINTAVRCVVLVFGPSSSRIRLPI